MYACEFSYWYHATTGRPLLGRARGVVWRLEQMRHRRRYGTCRVIVDDDGSTPFLRHVLVLYLQWVTSVVNRGLRPVCLASSRPLWTLLTRDINTADSRFKAVTMRNFNTTRGHTFHASLILDADNLALRPAFARAFAAVTTTIPLDGPAPFIIIHGNFTRRPPRRRLSGRISYILSRPDIFTLVDARDPLPAVLPRPVRLRPWSPPRSFSVPIIKPYDAQHPPTQLKIVA